MNTSVCLDEMNNELNTNEYGDLHFDWSAMFNVSEFVPRSYVVSLPSAPMPSSLCGFTTLSQRARRVEVLAKPTIQHLYRVIQRLFERARLNAECVIIALIYIERVCSMRRARLTVDNWLPMVVVSLLTASKVWDDHSSFNAEVAAIFPFFTLKNLNKLEQCFLCALNYSLYISSSDYARYYFALRSMRPTATTASSTSANTRSAATAAPITAFTLRAHQQ